MKETTNEKSHGSERQENPKNVRISLHVLQPAATDKENLVGPGRTPILNKDKIKVQSEHENKANEMTLKVSSKKKKTTKVSEQESCNETITAEDLIGEPSAAYWKQLAEVRRVALAEALKENETLVKKVELLEQEKSLIEDMLNDARSLIDVLNEVINEEPTEDSEDDQQ